MALKRYVEVDGKYVPMTDDEFRDYNMRMTSPYSMDTYDRVTDGYDDAAMYADYVDYLDEMEEERKFQERLNDPTGGLSWRATPEDQTFDYERTHPRAVGQPMRSSEPLMMESDISPLSRSFSDMITGIAPGEKSAPAPYDVAGWMEYDPYVEPEEESSILDHVVNMSEYLIPVYGQGKILKDYVDEFNNGGVPSLASLLLFDVPFMKSLPKQMKDVRNLTKTIGRYGKAFGEGYKRGKARRASYDSVKKIGGPKTQKQSKYTVYDKDGNEILRGDNGLFRVKWKAPEKK